MSELYRSSQLRRVLNMNQFEVTRRKQTQQPYQNQYWNLFQPGVYCCVVCNKPLFSSQAKYEDGFGWPAFYFQLPKAGIKRLANYELDYVRTEALCGQCNSHLGFVFNDGPTQNGGKRYSVNSASLKFYRK